MMLYTIIVVVAMLGFISVTVTAFLIGCIVGRSANVDDELRELRDDYEKAKEQRRDRQIDECVARVMKEMERPT